MSAGSLRVEAHAKVNLTLEILSKRSDGFHNLVSVIQTIDLHDEIVLTPAEDIAITCDEPSLNTHDNLAYVAATALKKASGASGGVHIDVQKSIPVAAGLGGGSSDAAAVLRGLNELWGCGLGVDALAALGAEIGSDVPYLIRGGTALVQGRGEDVSALPNAALEWLVLLTPEVKLKNKTAALFSRLSAANYTRGALSHKLAGRTRGKSDMPAEFLFNGFDAIAADAFPRFAEYRDGFAGIGAQNVVLSGAGPTMFAVPPSREMGVAWELLLKNRGWDARLVRPWWPSPSGQAE
jgi:4-diphosphocytidyl-2-C-methyl-D-erythritol kinase